MARDRGPGGHREASAWLHNLAAEPEAVVQFADGRRVDVHADTLAGDDLAAAWERIARQAPRVRRLSLRDGSRDPGRPPEPQLTRGARAARRVVPCHAGG